MPSNINPNLSASRNSAPVRIALTVTFATGKFTVKKGATTLINAVTYLHGGKLVPDDALAALRALGPYDTGALVDFTMPLSGGGSRIETYPITHGMKHGATYNG